MSSEVSENGFDDDTAESKAADANKGHTNEDGQS
jgi:hypothetical protein